MDNLNNKKIPDRRLMERMQKDIHRLLGQQNFKSIDEANAYLKTLMGKEMPHAPAQSPLEEANELVYQAIERDDSQCVGLARKALELSEDCVEAYVLLAEEAESLSDEMDLYKKGVAAGERVLGVDFFTRNKGHFWGITESRPYMRARFGLAECLWEAEHWDEAIDHYREMLALNPNDNQGVRYTLVAYLLERKRFEEAKALLDGSAYGEDCSAEWLYNRALVYFHFDGATDAAAQALRDAIRANRYIPEYLFMIKEMPKKLPRTITMGGEDEAVAYIGTCGGAWADEPDALEWFLDVLEA